jgi:membrane dipeptidase
MHQVLDITRAPIVFSHSNARALCDHRRNVPDDVLDRVAGNGGVVMLTFIPSFLNPKRRNWERKFETAGGPIDLEALQAATRAGSNDPPPPAATEMVADHIEYVANRVGPAHVGIGSDFFGSRMDTPVGLEDVSRFPHLFAELMLRGWADEPLAALAGGNFLRVFTAVERIGRKLRRTESARTGTVADYDVPNPPNAKERA